MKSFLQLIFGTMIIIGMLLFAAPFAFLGWLFDLGDDVYYPHEMI